MENIPDESINFCITDPPYGVGKEFEKGINLDRLSSQWVRHLRSAEDAFPRDVNIPRVKVNSLDEYRAVLNFSYLKDCYVSVYSKRQISEKTMDTLFIDIDSQNFTHTLWQLREIKRSWNNVRAYMSGAKGFHLWLDIPSTPRDSFTKRGLLDFLNRGSGLSYVDPAPLLDIQRVSRIPYTVNSKTGLWCVPIDPLTDTIETITARAIDPFSDFKVIEVKPSTALRDDIINACIEGYADPSQRWDARPAFDRGIYAYIEELLKHPVSDGRHRILWLILAPYFVNILNLPSIEAEAHITEYLKRCDAAEPTDALGKVGYFVEYSKRTELMPLGERRFREMFPEATV